MAQVRPASYALAVGFRHGTSNERGFTLIEMAVVMIIIGTLAAIAIPVFFRQRDRGFVAQSQSALANAKLAAQSYYVGEGDGAYTGLDEDAIFDEGVRIAEGIELIAFAPGAQEFCIAAVHPSLPADDPWQIAVVSSESGTPVPANECFVEDE